MEFTECKVTQKNRYNVSFSLKKATKKIKASQIPMQFPCKSLPSPIFSHYGERTCMRTCNAEVGFWCYYHPKSFRDFNYFNKKYAHAIGSFPPQLLTYASPFLLKLLK